MKTVSARYHSIAPAITSRRESDLASLPQPTAPILESAYNRRAIAWWYLTPTLFVLACIAGWPLLRTIFFSFTNAQLFALKSAQWIGFTNYINLLTNNAWWQCVRNTLWFAVLSVSLETILGLMIALILHSQFKGRGFLRAAVLIPWAIPTIISAKMWGWMYHDIYGILNEILISIGLIKTGLAWTADSNLSMWAVIFADVWKTTPFMALLLLAGLQVIPHECIEAAKMDGINPIRIFWRITLPLLKPALIVAITFRMLDALRVFDLIYILTNNTPGTISMSVFARKQLFDFQDVGLGSAASTLLFFMVSICTLIYLSFVRGRMNDR